MTKQEFNSLTLSKFYIGAIGYAPHDKPVKFRLCMFKTDHVYIEGSIHNFKTYHYKSITLPAKK